MLSKRFVLPLLLPFISQQRLSGFGLELQSAEVTLRVAGVGTGAGARAARPCTPTHACACPCTPLHTQGCEGALPLLPWVAGGQLFHQPLEPVQASKAMFLQLMHGLFRGCLQQGMEALPVKTPIRDSPEQPAAGGAFPTLHPAKRAKSTQLPASLTGGTRGLNMPC